MKVEHRPTDAASMLRVDCQYSEQQADGCRRRSARDAGVVESDCCRRCTKASAVVGGLWDVSYTSIVLWFEMIRIARVEGCAPPAESRGLCNDGYHYNSLLYVDELG